MHKRRIALAAALAILLNVFWLAAHAQPSSPKRILLISTGTRISPGFVLVDREIQKVLGERAAGGVETYAENLDTIRFPAERSQRIFDEYLRAKYAQTRPDVVVLFFVGNLGVTVPALERIFPGTPIVVGGYTEEPLRPDQFGPLVKGYAHRVKPEETLALMLRAHRNLRRIVVIGGTADVDREMMVRVRHAAHGFENRVAFDFWEDRRIADLRQAVTKLAPDTAILFTRMFRDAAGQALVSSEVAQGIGHSANVPVYILTDTHFGTGAVGGALASAEVFGKRAGDLAIRVLEGMPIESLPFEIRDDTVPVFDWNALQRWGISESILPPGSDVRFRPPSVWGQYGPYIGGALLVILMQGAVIAVLFAERRRRRSAQASLQENRQLVELATDAGELGLWSRELDDDLVWVNAPMRALCGFGPREDVRMEDLASCVHPDDRERVRAEIEGAQAAGLPFEGEFRLRLRDGTERWVMARGRSVADRRGAVTRRMGAVLDITSRRNAEESLRRQRAFLRQVIDVTPNFIFAKDREGRFTLANQAVADVYGVPVTQVIGKTDADFNSNAQEVAAFRRADLEVMDTMKERFIVEESITDSAGRVRWLQTVKRPLVGEDGRADQVLGASTDITERRQAELELQARRAELAHVTRVSLMGELAASLAHELNQPLAAILSNAGAALRFMDDPANAGEVREILEDIMEADNRAAEVIRQMRALVRKDEAPEFSALDLEGVVRDVVALVHSDAVRHNVRLVVEVDSGLPAVWGHAVQLQQVLLNLLVNAFDAMSDPDSMPREVLVRVQREDARMNRVAVSDRGPGLSGNAPERIFEPFYTTKRAGLGMGLSICRSIIQAHAGRLWAENNPKRGATLYFTVPVQP